MSTTAARRTDTLIVGQGLAGSLLADELLRRGVDLMLLDDGWHSSSSLAAAGLINPVTGQRLVMTAGLGNFLPAAETCYRELEQRYGIRLFHPRPMLRLIRKPDEIRRLEKRLCDSRYRKLLGDMLSSTEMPGNLRAPLGAFPQYRAGFVDLPLLLDKVRQDLLRQRRLIERPFDHSQLAFDSSGIVFDNIRTERLIFCEGYRGRNNPWFGALPFQPAKGEILTLELEKCPTDSILSAGRWLIPLSDNRYRLGSNYEHERLDEQPTENIRTTLLAGLGDLLNDPGSIRVLEHRAGVRPSTRGAQPFIGSHPLHPQLHIFNGFGSKGSLLIPWHARQYAEVLTANAEIPAEADIQRHHGLLVADR